VDQFLSDLRRDEVSENTSMEILNCEIIYDDRFPHSLEDSKQEFTSTHSLETQSENPQENSQKVGETTSVLFNEQEDSLDAIIGCHI
jgi:hypothetical protein